MGEEMKSRTAVVNWDGDVESLIPYVDRLRSDSELADQVFVNRQEAFEAGLWIGRHADRVARVEAAGASQDC
jgi:hypothetical protein